MQYIALNCGGGIEAGSDVLTLEQQTVGASKQITVSQAPQDFTSTSGTIGWWKKSSQDDSAYSKFEFDDDAKTATLSDAEVGDVVCIKYVTNDASAKKFVVNADYIPSTVHAVMTVGLYKAGTTKETLTTSSKIGNLIIDVPNFQLEGTQDLGLTSSGIASMSLSGSALATFGGNSGCSDHGYYAIITEQLFGADEFSNVSAIVVANSDVELASGETETLKVYKMYNDGTQPSLVSNSKLTFTASGSSATVDTSGKITAGSTTGTTTIEVVVTSKNTLLAQAVVTVS